MDDSNPLFYVALAYLVLWVIAKLLAKEPLSEETREFRSGKRRGVNLYGPRGVKFSTGMRVYGLDTAGIDELKTLIENKDEYNLANFIAAQRPNFVELEEYFNILRERFFGFLEKDIYDATEIEKISAANRVLLTDHPKHINIKALNSPQLRNLYAYNPEENNSIDHDFINRFGGAGFMKRFAKYIRLRRGRSITVLVTKDDSHRADYEELLGSGLIQQGRKITLKDRLTVLKFGQLIDIASDLKVNSNFKTVDEAAIYLADTPGSATALSMTYAIDDIFHINASPFDEQQIEMEWAAIKAYSNVLCNPS